MTGVQRITSIYMLANGFGPETSKIMKVNLILSLALTTAIVCVNAAPSHICDDEIQQSLATDSLDIESSTQKRSINTDWSNYCQGHGHSHHAHKRHKKHGHRHKKHGHWHKKHGHHHKKHTHKHNNECSDQPQPTEIERCTTVDSTRPTTTKIESSSRDIEAPATIPSAHPKSPAVETKTPLRFSTNAPVFTSSPEPPHSSATSVMIVTSTLPAFIVPRPTLTEKPSATTDAGVVLSSSTTSPRVSVSATLTMAESESPARGATSSPTMSESTPSLMTTLATTDQPATSTSTALTTVATTSEIITTTESTTTTETTTTSESITIATIADTTTTSESATITTIADTTTTSESATITTIADTTTTSESTKITTIADTTTTSESTTITTIADTTTTTQGTTPVTTLPSTTTVISSTSTTATPTPVSTACADLAAQGVDKTSTLQYQTVLDCYRSMQFDPTVANSILSTLDSLLGNIYAFLDMAMVGYGGALAGASAEGFNATSAAAFKAAADEPFKTPAVDLKAGLQKIRSTQWTSDYDFSMALTYLLFSVHDAHLAYLSECYQIAWFAQPIYLYAPVENGVQSVKIFAANYDNPNVPQQSIEDCVVTTIDGLPALKAIQDFADRSSIVSKDPGVRLNDALITESWSQSWGLRPGGFNMRWEVPAKASMDYTIQCGSEDPQSFSVPWTVTPSEKFLFGQFTDAPSYWSTQCLASFTSADDESGEGQVTLPPAVTLFKERGTVTVPESRYNYHNYAADPNKNATLQATTHTSAFYMLNDLPSASIPHKVCVAVIASEVDLTTQKNPEQSEYEAFAAGVFGLADQGCTKLIFDMTNNGGGSVDFAYFINQLFFPAEEPYFVLDIRSTPFVEKVATVAGSSNVASSFDARDYIDLSTQAPYTDQSMFLAGVNYTRGGITEKYSQKCHLSYNLVPDSLKRALPWKAADMAIVTNGNCGSSGSLIATRFAAIHGVKTYAIGGIYNTPLSYFSFPGGFVKNNKDIVDNLKAIGFQSADAPTQFPVKASGTFTMGEVYISKDATVPLEYDTQYFPAQVHLDQEALYLRQPDTTWFRVAADFV
ncbi:unnamed protein product [Mortierella alpina]